MRKFTFLFCTKPQMFLSEIPVILLAVLAISLNDSVETVPKLYPLIVLSILFALFIFIYFFRIIIISEENVRTLGVFSSHDNVILNQGKTLILTRKPHGNMGVAVFGNDGTPPALDWAKNEEHELLDIFLYRERAVGSDGDIRRVLNYFSVPSDDVDALFKTNSFNKEYECFILSAEKSEDNLEVKIKFTTTM